MKLKQMNVTIIALSLLTAALSCKEQTPFPDDEGPDKSDYEYMEDWQEGYLDIHQICTGRGNCTFMILPDGTTLMVDVGDLGDPNNIAQEIMPALPSVSKHPAEWIARYVKHFSKPLDNDEKLDYVSLTHFDADHIGKDDGLAVSVPGKKYKLSGVTHLAQLLEIGTLVDRGYPDYDYPSKERLLADCGSHFRNYHEYVKERVSEGGTIEKFKIGSNTQFRLLNKPSDYTDFEIRNIMVNGAIWTGKGETATQLIPDATTLPNHLPGENRSSSVITMSYGKFKYFSGGDIMGQISGTYPWADLETPVGKLVGEMDVVLCNHHASSDAMHENFLKAVKAQAYIIPVWDYYHPQPEALARILDKTLYSADRLIFAAGLVANNRIRLGEDGKKIEPDGHIVVRVYPGGDEFRIFVLNAASEDYEIIHKTEKMQSK